MRYDYFEIKGNYIDKDGNGISTLNRVLYEEGDDEVAVTNAAIQLQNTIQTEIANVLFPTPSP